MEVTRRSIDPDVADALRDWRRQRGWSQHRAAREIGTSQGYVWQLERGQRCPSTAMAELIIGAYTLTGRDALRLRAVALSDVGRSWRRACGCDRRRRCGEHVA